MSRRRPPRTSRVLAALVAAGGLVAGCAESFEDLPPEATVSAVTVSGDGRDVAFSIDLCSRPLLELLVEETPDEVRVLAVTERGPDPNDCALEVSRRLDARLGDRPVIDLSRSERITRIDDLTTDAPTE